MAATRGQLQMANWSAQASAAAADSHQDGVHPIPYASSSPCLLTTAMPKPEHLSAFHLPSSSEPSQYQVASCHLGSSSGMGTNHWIVPSCAKGATPISRTRNPCSATCLCFCSDSLDPTHPASGGGSGHECRLHALSVKPLVPHRECPRSGDGRACLKGRVESATASIDGQ